MTYLLDEKESSVYKKIVQGVSKHGWNECVGYEDLTDEETQIALFLQLNGLIEPVIDDNNDCLGWTKNAKKAPLVKLSN